MIAPFLKGKFGWVEPDGCWWCGGGRQTSEHLFKECRAWKDEIRSLWKKVGEISGDIRVRSGGEIYKGRKGFCFGVDRKIVRPGNTSVRKLLGDERFMEAVLKSLEYTGVGKIRLSRGSCLTDSFSPSSFLFLFSSFLSFPLFLFLSFLHSLFLSFSSQAVHLRRIRCPFLGASFSFSGMTFGCCHERSFGIAH